MACLWIFFSKIRRNWSGCADTAIRSVIVDARYGSKNSRASPVLAKEGAWVASGQILSALAALVSIRIMTELLPPTEFGRLTLLMGAATLLLGLAATPRLQAVMRYYPEWHGKGEVSVLRETATRLLCFPVAAATAALAGGWCIYAMFTDQEWWAGLLLAALLAVDAVRSFELVLLNAARRQRSSAIIHAADGWSRPLLAVPAVLMLGQNAEAALVGYTAGSMLVLALLRQFTRLEGKGANPLVVPKEGASGAQKELAAAIRRYAWPLAPLAVFGWLNGMGDRYIIAGILSMAEVGLYAAAFGLASRPFLMMSGIIELTLRPVLQNAIATGDRAAIDVAKRRMLLTMVCGSALGVLGFLLLSELAARLFLAEEYRAAVSLMPWIALGYALYVTSTVYSRFCYAFDATGSILSLTVVSSLAGIAVLVPLAIWFGLTGAVMAVPVRFAIELVLARMYSRRAERTYLARKLAVGDAGG